MSAEKCGKPVGIVVDPVSVKIQNRKPPLIVAGKALDALKRIQAKCPDFDPNNVSEIWVKAYRLGLVNEE